MNFSTVLRKIDTLQSNIVTVLKNTVDKLKCNFAILKWLRTSEGKKVFVSEIKKVIFLLAKTHQIFLTEANYCLRRLDVSVDFLDSDQPFVFRSTVLRKIDTLQLNIITALKNIADKWKSTSVIIELLETSRGKQILVLMAKKVMLSLTDAHQIFLEEANRYLRRLLEEEEEEVRRRERRLLKEANRRRLLAAKLAEANRCPRKLDASVDFPIPSNTKPFVTHKRLVEKIADNVPVKISLEKLDRWKDNWADDKVRVMGIGDFTHSAWFEERVEITFRVASRNIPSNTKPVETTDCILRRAVEQDKIRYRLRSLCNKEGRLYGCVGDASVDFPGNKKPFVVRNLFVENIADGALVKIVYLDDNFKSWFLDQTVPAGPGYQIAFWDLVFWGMTKEVTDFGQVFENFEMDLATVYYLMRLQRNGEDGILRTDGNNNIFYILDVEGKCRAVSVNWDFMEYFGWNIHAFTATTNMELSSRLITRTSFISLIRGSIAQYLRC